MQSPMWVVSTGKTSFIRRSGRDSDVAPMAGSRQKFDIVFSRC